MISEGTSVEEIKLRPLDYYASTQIRLFRILGLWKLDPSKAHGWRLIFHYVHRLFICTIAFSHSMCYLAKFLLYIHDINQVARNAVVMLYVLLGVMKQWFILYNQNQIQKFLRLWDNAHDDKRFVKCRVDLTTDVANKCRKLTYTMWVFGLAMVIHWHLFPLFISESNEIIAKNGTNNSDIPRSYRYLPIEAVYPFDEQISPNYEIAYWLQNVMGPIILTTNVTFDNFFIVLLMLVSVQLDHIVNTLKKVSVRNSDQVHMIPKGAAATRSGHVGFSMEDAINDELIHAVDLKTLVSLEDDDAIDEESLYSTIMYCVKVHWETIR